MLIVTDLDAIAEEMKDFINEDIEEEGDGEESEEEEGGGKRKHDDDDEIDDRLEDEDFDLIEENLGIKVNRKVILPNNLSCCSFTQLRS